jgi:hypothetical protein
MNGTLSAGLTNTNRRHMGILVGRSAPSSVSGQRRKGTLRDEIGSIDSKDGWSKLHVHNPALRGTLRGDSGACCGMNWDRQLMLP